MPPEKKIKRGVSAAKKAMADKHAGWTVYVVRCANGAFYTGITNKLKERIKAHNSGKGAKYTASFGPVRLAWSKKIKGRSAASKLESRIKQLTRAEKINLIRRRRAVFPHS